MNAELMQWLIYAAVAVGGYWLRHAGILQPSAPQPSQPASPSLPPGIDLAQLFDLMRKLLETPPPAPKP